MIIAYVHDDGEDFWRAKYVNDYETADLDSEEIVKALKESLTQFRSPLQAPCVVAKKN